MSKARPKLTVLTPTAGTRRRALLCSGLAGASALLYLTSLAIPFIYDDFRMVVENRSIRDLSDLRAVLLLEITRPLLNLSYAIDRAVWGPQPFGFHLTNLLLHALNVALLFQLAYRMAADDEARHAGQLNETGPEAVAVTAGALFAVHPMMTEAVSYIAGRSEVLCGTFFLLAMLSARKWMFSRRPVWWVLTAICWAAALATKEIAAMFPLVLLAYERLVLTLSPSDRRRVFWKLHVPLLAIALVGGLARIAVLALVEHPGAVQVHWSYALVAADVVRRYVLLMLVPTGQTIFHAVPATTLEDPRALAAIGSIAIILGVAWAARRSSGLATLGLCWFLLLLVPSSMLVLLDHGEPMAEHRVYFASCGLFIAVGTGIRWFATRMALASDRVRPVMLAIALVGLFWLSGRTVLRNAVWTSPAGLWAEAAAKAPEHWLPHMRLGEVLQAAGLREKAIEEYNLAISLRPEEQMAYQKLALTYAELRRYDEARKVFERLRRLDPQSAIASNGLGAVAMVSGERARARAHFRETMANDAANVPARQSLAMIAETEPVDPAEALRLCQEIQALAPRTPGNDDCIRRNQARLSAGTPDAH